ncbi:MAG: hypothetical protein ACKVTZ_23920, partial [Bacteroidia bacterium]
MSKKKKSSAQKPLPVSDKQLIKERARKMPLHACFVNKGWEDEGQAMIIVVRKMGSEKYIVGAYLVDIFCLGLKDTYFHILPEENFQEFQKNLQPSHIPMDFALAQNVIYGAIEYAEDLGFQPAGAFQTTEYILDDIDDVEYQEVPFGKEGKPFYIQSYDDRNSAHILKMLENKVGAGNFHYLLAIDNPDFQEDDESQAEFEDLIDFYNEEFEEEIADLSGEKRAELRFNMTIIATMELIERTLREGDEELSEEHYALVGEEMGRDFGEFLAEEEGLSEEAVKEKGQVMATEIARKAENFHKALLVLREEDENAQWRDVIEVLLDLEMETGLTDDAEENEANL